MYAHGLRMHQPTPRLVSFFPAAIVMSYFPFFFSSFLGAPATQVEIYIMATSLDSDGDKEIDYREFKKMRRRIKASAPIEKATELEEYEEPMAQLQPCPKCNVGLWEPVVEDVTG